MAGEAEGDKGATQTPEELHDAAIVATEAWQADPTEETKAVAVKAVTTAKEAHTKAKEKSTADAKTAAELAEKNKPPEKYDLKLPEGSPLGADHLERTAAHARTQGLNQEQAQALVQREHDVVTAHLGSDAYKDGQRAFLDQKGEEWVTAAKADKEIGGEEFGKNVELAKRVVTRYGSDDLKKALTESGLGDHPELVRMLVRIGRAMTDDQLVPAGSRSSGAGKSTAELLYGGGDKK